MASITPIATATTTPKKCYPCRAQGVARIEVLLGPALKTDVKNYCQQRGFTMSGLIEKLLKKEVQ